MFSASLGGRDAARVRVYRHGLIRLITGLLGPMASAGGWSPLAMTLAALLMSWDAAPTLAQRFESALAVLDRVLPRRRRTGRTYQGFVKALTRHSEMLVGLLLPRLRARTIEIAGKFWTMGRWIPIGVDGSKFDAPRTIANEVLGAGGRAKSGPQMNLLLLVHLGAMLPWGWAVGRASDSERTLLRRAMDQFPTGSLLVADAGFVGFDLLSTLRSRGVSFLIRVGGDARLLSHLGYYRREGKHTVYLWPNAMHDREPLVLRLIRVGSVHLVTDVADPRELSRNTASELYRRRWGLEVTFRSLKQVLQRRKVRSCTPEHAKIELAWAVLGLWTLALLGARAIRGADQEPRRLSTALTLAAVRHAMHSGLGHHALHRRLRRCVIDDSPRDSSKTAYRWPRKRDQAPPGPPQITKASRSQVLAAREFREAVDAA
jgi:hypothetical protein